MKTIKELGISHAPWQNIGVDNNPLGFVRIIDKDGFFVADVDGESDENQHANAHVIAAAPKMYEKAYSVLNNLLTHLQWPEETIRMNRAEVAAMAKELQEALAEASGEVSNG